ncbi:hypothetical protein VKT23_005715 [Stygiomarasmius scandens]|uniref:Uncharacterized protein n=1 Tax=Marasmiellus scandens TaxID=2682957 RepID=A0ABR1JQV1_9AGAR
MSTSEKDAKQLSDVESVQDNAPYHEGTGETGLVRQLKNRHIAMISIGGVIGTGLFLGQSTTPDILKSY